MEQTLELTAVREALQSRLLVELMGNAMHKELVLKGGLAMRAVHGSVRHTKDIDLDSDLKHSKERVQGIVKRSIERAIASGLIENAQVTAPKQTETTLRWKILGTQPGSNAPMNLTVEISRRATISNGHIIEVPLPDAFRALGGASKAATVQVLDSQAIAVTKVLALTDPNRMAPRDLYDLHVLIEACVQDPSNLLASIPNAADGLPQVMAELWPKIESMSYEQFKTDVIPYLPADVGASIDADAFDDMRVNVATNVEKWLQNATSALGAPPSVRGSLLGAIAPAPAPSSPTASDAPVVRPTPKA